MASLSPAALRGWTPVWVSTRGEPAVEWALVDAPFTDPFFEQATMRAMQHPFNLAFARRTPLAVLDAFREQAPAHAPSGFVFHMSRCGSTLIAQMLAQLSSSIVLSEPQPLDALLRLHRRGVPEETLIGWLRGLLSALAPPRGGEQRLFVKFHAWHVLELPLILRAFPGVPWIFVFREPRAVLRSQERAPGAEVLFGTIDPAFAGLDPAAGNAASRERYAAQVIAAFCDAALRHAQLGRSAFVDYADLPNAVISQVLPFFGVRAGEGDVRRMRQVAALDPKSAGEAFQPRPAEPGGSGEIDRLAAELLDVGFASLREGALRSQATLSSRSGRSSP